MEPPKGLWASLWSFICFLPYFIGLMLLGTIKGAILCPLICILMTIGNSAIILGLWFAHCIWTYFCVVRANKLGPILKLVMCICVLPVLLILWPAAGIVGSIIGGAAYGFLSPIFATLEAVEEGKENKFYHCFTDGMRSTILKTCDTLKDVRNVCFHSYFSVMDDLRQEGLPNGKFYEIRLHYLSGAVIAAVLGIIVDMPIVSFVAICKGPYMLFKGWNRLFHDLIGREGPFLETMCVPFAGLAILLWPLAVVGSILASMIASIFLGAYAGVVTYQESFLLGLRYIVAALSLYDEYSNDILGMPEGSCFPRPRYRKKVEKSWSFSHANSFSRPTNPLQKTPSRTFSLKDNIAELKPLELFDGLFKDCHYVAETLVSEGLITHEDIQEAKSGKGSRIISIGLPSYCLLQVLLRSVKANSPGILLSDGTELATTNGAKAKIFEWLINPLLIIKEQIKAENLSVSEEDYLCKLVLLNGDSNRINHSTITAPESDRKRAELDALARRLQGITKYMSRLPTYKRRFDDLVRTLSDQLADKHGSASTIIRSKSAFARIISIKSFKGKETDGPDQESEHARDSDTSL